jgi:hypothetical protein
MHDDAMAALVFLAGVALLFLLGLWVTWRIVRKAGYHGAWSLIILLPLVNLVAVYVFAFSDWPALRRRRTRQDDGSVARVRL